MSKERIKGEKKEGNKKQKGLSKEENKEDK